MWSWWIHSRRNKTQRTVVPLWPGGGNDPVAFGAALAALQEAGIPHEQMVMHEPYSILAMRTPGYGILVHSDDVARAKNVL